MCLSAFSREYGLNLLSTTENQIGMGLA